MADAVTDDVDAMSVIIVTAGAEQWMQVAEVTESHRSRVYSSQLLFCHQAGNMSV